MSPGMGDTPQNQCDILCSERWHSIMVKSTDSGARLPGFTNLTLPFASCVVSGHFLFPHL